MGYRINGKRVTKDEFFANSKPIDWSAPPAFQIARDYEAYECPVTGNMIEGRSAHRENLKQHGCRIFEPGEREQFIRDRPREMERDAERAADFLVQRMAEKL